MATRKDKNKQCVLVVTPQETNKVLPDLYKATENIRRKKDCTPRCERGCASLGNLTNLARTDQITFGMK